MSFNREDVLRRFHRTLVREIQAKNPSYVNAPFSVAEIYQNLVPYRTHRDVIGVEMNADYEHALLRLLAGEGDYLTIESRTARQEIRDELESPNPNTGLYRDFAAADVRLNPDKVDVALEWAELQAPETDPGLPAGVLPAEAPEPGEGEGEGGGEELALRELPPDLSREGPLPGWGGDEELPPVEEGVGPEEAKGGEEAAGSPAPAPPEPCPWCRASLPSRPNMKFCPFCGSNLHLVPCPACGEELELTWRFCIACGTEVAS